MSSWRTRASVSTGLHVMGPTRLTVAEREESFTRTESVARWSREGRAVYEAEREALLFDFFLFFASWPGVSCSNRAENNYTRWDGDFFHSEKIGFIFIVFAVLLCLCFLFRTCEYRRRAYQVPKEENKYPPWGMYVRTASATRIVCGFRAVFS